MLESAQIDAIVEQVMSELGQGERVRHGPTPAPVTTLLPPEPARSLQHGDNLFPDVDRAVAAAQGAFEALQALPLEVRESMISQIRRLARENAQVLAYEAWKETGMRRYEVGAFRSDRCHTTQHQSHFDSDLQHDSHGSGRECRCLQRTPGI